MPLKTSFQPYTLEFKFDAGTSRGVLREKETWFIKVWDEANPKIFGLGEAGPLKKLSIDDREDMHQQLAIILRTLEGREHPKSEEEIYQIAKELAGRDFPSVRFALETALLDLLNGGERIIFKNAFTSSGLKIPINGLIWMGHTDSMLLQITDKVAAGFDCIKMKIGSMDFEKECDILDYVRRKYYQKELLIRVDANGAFKVEEALSQLHTLSKYKIHSIEQPIKAGQPEAMRKLCEQSPIGIALDEELIGVYNKSEKEALLREIRPHYIILKPTLAGGIRSCIEWVEIAAAMNIGWWLTSALESNIGLNAICQLAVHLKAISYQGLGTGQLYYNNIPSPLSVESGHIGYNSHVQWDLKDLTL
ncbi:O-succinylbenzoate synthase [Fulvivirga imtechensis AK7]|uniref:O-succinylbenzoate synthase n=1 Tax=Fulvivirga imtechensis AK7 TaxID=1237149 RepID=L8JUE9_9BACT|nr:o-succinylbenzoate synthase [Fulvivirga imtechensis]ELR72405.1 O-succinylbenzoate synthase [Fulvivirga imtechensis AK7]